MDKELKLSSLKHFKLVPTKTLNQAFIKKGIHNLYDAIKFVNILPYGRNQNRHDYTAVLTESRGTCSTKHALIAKLAQECDAPVELCLCVYLMNSKNQPAIKPVLSQYHLQQLPEAHTFLRYETLRVDITFPDRTRYLTQSNHLTEITLSPEQIGPFKTNWHKNFLRQWQPEAAPDKTVETLWSIREACIERLSA